MISEEFLEKEGWVFYPNPRNVKFKGECSNGKYPDWHIVGTPGHPDGELFVNYKTDKVEFIESEDDYYKLFRDEGK